MKILFQHVLLERFIVELVYNFLTSDISLRSPGIGSWWSQVLRVVRVKQNDRYDMRHDYCL